jgi:hypothetical protein
VIRQLRLFAQRNVAYLRPLAQILAGYALIGGSAPLGIAIGVRLNPHGWLDCLACGGAITMLAFGVMSLGFLACWTARWPSPDDVFEARGRAIIARMRRAGADLHTASEGLGSVDSNRKDPAR